MEESSGDDNKQETPASHLHAHPHKSVHPPDHAAPDPAAGFSFTPPPSSPALVAAPVLAPPAPETPAAPAPPVVNPTPPLPPAAPPPQDPAGPHSTNAHTIILQWLTYAFWGWTVLTLSILTAAVFSDFLNGSDSSSFNYYAISAALVLLPISLACDFLYSKKEPEKKVGAAMVVMVIHAVLFALFGIGSLIYVVFSIVSLLTSSGDYGGGSSSTLIGLYSGLVITVFYAATFVRTLNPPNFPWLTQAYKFFMLVLVGVFIILGFVGARIHKDTSTQPYYSSDSSSSSSTSNYKSVEEVNKQGERRPPQYLHICNTDNDIEYVSQGNPKCLGKDTYDSDYDTSVPGTAFSSPCKVDSKTARYVYISNDETCPSGTTLLFYNSLGGSTSGPSANDY